MATFATEWILSGFPYVLAQLPDHATVWALAANLRLERQPVASLKPVLETSGMAGRGSIHTAWVLDRSLQAGGSELSPDIVAQLRALGNDEIVYVKYTYSDLWPHRVGDVTPRAEDEDNDL